MATSDKRPIDNVSLSSSTDAPPVKRPVPPGETIPEEVRIKSEDFTHLFLSALNSESVESKLRETLVAPLLTKIAEQESTINELRNHITSLESRTDDLEQYSRRNAIRVFGVQESAKTTDEEILAVVNDKMELDIHLNDIDRSHRVGKPRQDQSSPRPIICKFTSYRTKQKIMSNRRKLSSSGIYINDDLTAKRATAAKLARDLVKKKILNQTWVHDGKIFTKDLSDRVEVCNNIEQLQRLDAPQEHQQRPVDPRPRPNEPSTPLQQGASPILMPSPPFFSSPFLGFPHHQWNYGNQVSSMNSFPYYFNTPRL